MLSFKANCWRRTRDAARQTFPITIAHLWRFLAAKERILFSNYFKTLTSQLLSTESGHTIRVARGPVAGVLPETGPHSDVPEAKTI